MKTSRFRIITLFADILILAIGFFIMILTKPDSLKSYLPSHSMFFMGLALMWLLVSLLNGKMHRGKIINFNSLLSKVVTSNIIALSITVLLMYTFRTYYYSRAIVFGTAIIATALELIFGSIFIAYKKANLQDYEEYEKYRAYRKPSEYDLVGVTNGKNQNKAADLKINPGIRAEIEGECGKEMADAVVSMTGPRINGSTAVLSTTTIFNISSLPGETYSYIINLHRVNDIKRPDDFFDAVNRKLKDKGYFFCCVETKDQRKQRLLKKFPPVLNWIYYTLDFFIKRILPKIKITRPIYFLLTRGENAVMSRAEILGRLSRAGFRIIQESFIGNKLCIEAGKYSSPLPRKDYLYGPLIALPRIGKEGMMIKVYKLRTMHPYSEYIQGYVYHLHDLQEGGKFRHDFRITSWGAVCRKIWLDELPTLINFFQGDMKLVGVRPLSEHYFDLYKQEVRERRIRYKPGLIPPFYAHMPTDLESIQASEMKYLDEYDRHPFWTDFRYFWMSIWNILFRNARSH